MYKTEKYEAEISVEDYLEGYVAVDEFLEYCKQCDNYNKKWSCPPYDFDVVSYWKKHKQLKLEAVKIIYDEDIAGQAYSKEEQEEIFKQSVWIEKSRLSRELMEKEADYPGSVSLAAGACAWCKGKCAKETGEKCRYPEKMRYSMESLGGNVGLTLRKLMKLDLEWIEEGKMPHYFVLVGGLLI